MTDDTGTTVTTKAQMEAAALFASTDIARPTLNVVEFNGARLRATDSYRAITIPTEAGDETHRRTVRLADVKSAARLAGKAEHVVLSDTFSLLDTGARLPAEEVEGIYPDFDRLTATLPDETASVTLNAAFLADICIAAKKLATGARCTCPSVTLHLHGEHKPVTFDILQITSPGLHISLATGIIMPIHRDKRET